MGKLSLTKVQTSELLSNLKTRSEYFLKGKDKPNWEDLERKLINNPSKLWSIFQMEATGGEPAIVWINQGDNTITVVDCSSESPTGRRSLCFDTEALNKRKENKPRSSADAIATEMGIELLTEEEYKQLQQAGKFDLKTSSWIKTPESIRNLGGALFCDRRYDTVFTYHNGAESYYASRGFRGKVVVK